MKKLQRFCLTLDLKDDPDLIREYKFWHKRENIWPEIPEGIKSVGICSMEIYCIGSRLFMMIDAVPEFNFNQDMQRLATLPRQPEWETFVSKFQKANSGESSSEKWRLMEKIFSLE